MTPGRIAAVITCHDLGRTLDHALESVERQTRPPAEILVVDDASTDIYTRQVLARIQRHGTGVAQSPVRGVSAARNHGARLTTAEYLVWLDGDDLLEPRYFEGAGEKLDRDPDLAFVSCAMRAFGAASYEWKPSPPTFVEAVSSGGVPHASTMLRRRLWESIGGFDESLLSFELLDFWASAMEHGARGVVLDEPLLRYRVRPGSGYRRSIQPVAYLSRLRHFYAKHRNSVERYGLSLIEGKEAFLASQREHRTTLEQRKAALEAEVTSLQAQVAEAVGALRSRGASRVEGMDCGRLEPLSRSWGWDRGKPVDRRYIETFLDTHRDDIRGRVLEVRDSVYTRRFGGDAVTALDVLDIDASNCVATIIADLRRADDITTGTYDCIILTQTLHLIDEVSSAISECARILRPGGVLLATVPSIVRVDDEGGLDGDFWRLTEASARRLFGEAFPVEAFEVRSYGNVMAAAAFLYGMSVEELTPSDLDYVDSTFPVIVAIRAVKKHSMESGSSRSDNSVAPGFERTSQPVTSGFSWTSPSAAAGRSPNSALILAYHRIAELTPDSHELCTPPDVFRAHMEYVRCELTPIALDDLLRAAASGSMPERAVAVTLDDGYLDHLMVASPILCDLGVPATFFVNSDRLSEPHERWWDVLERIFLAGGELPCVVAVTIGGRELQLRTATARDRLAALERLGAMGRSLDADGRSRLVGDVVAWSQASALPRTTHRVLTDDEICALAARPGHTIGAHTVHHLALTEHSTETKRREVLENKSALERLLERSVDFFAYPYGEFEGDLLTIVRGAGFRAAVTVQEGRVVAGTNRFLLPRLQIAAGDYPRFRERLQETFEAHR